MKYGVVIAARTGSTRLPGKALLPLQGMPMIVFLIRRLKDSAFPGILHLATTLKPEDDLLASVVRAEGIPVFRGEDSDVMCRYVCAADQFGLDYVVRVTADCPFLNVEILQYCLARCEEFDGFDLASTKGRFPVGIDLEIYRASVMRELHGSRLPDAADREHLTKYLYDHAAAYTVRYIDPSPDWICKSRTFTVDTPDDYLWAQKAASRFGDERFSVKSLIENECV